MILPSAASQRASAPIVPARAASATPSATASSRGPTRAEPAAARARSAGARRLKPATITVLSGAAPGAGRQTVGLAGRLGLAPADVPEAAEQESGDDTRNDDGHAQAFHSSDGNSYTIS